MEDNFAGKIDECLLNRVVKYCLCIIGTAKANHPGEWEGGGMGRGRVGGRGNKGEREGEGRMGGRRKGGKREEEKGREGGRRVGVGGCLVVVAQCQNTGSSNQRCPGFDSWRQQAFSLSSISKSLYRMALCIISTTRYHHSPPPFRDC